MTDKVKTQRAANIGGGNEFLKVRVETYWMKPQVQSVNRRPTCRLHTVTVQSSECVRGPSSYTPVSQRSRCADRTGRPLSSRLSLTHELSALRSNWLCNVHNIRMLSSENMSIYFHQFRCSLSTLVFRERVTRSYRINRATEDGSVCKLMI